MTEFLQRLFEPVVLICILLSGAFCVYFTFKSWKNAKQNIVDNGAQHAITIGVTFTFIGIVIALFNFDVEDIESSIKIFLEGMKTAFITSLIGIIFGIVISRFIQGDVEKNSKTNLNEQFKNISQNSSDISDSLKEIVRISENNSSIADAIQALKESIEKSSTGVLVRELSYLSTAMERYIDAAENQTKAIAQLGENLNKSSAEQINAINTLSATQAESINQLGESLNKSSAEQIARLNSMDEAVKKMSGYSEKSYENSVTLLNETRDYQNKSLENERKQAEILSENTQRIMEMRNAFDEFLHQMAEVFSEQLINALNKSIKDLNDKLTEQFGDNFKQLNAAVIVLKDWQENYKDTVESTVGELSELNAAFRTFAVDVAPVLTETTERLSNSADSLSESSIRNVYIQKSLLETSQNLLDSVKETEQVAENLKAVNSTLIENQQSLLAEIETSFQKHTELMTKSLDDSLAVIVKTQEEQSAAMINAAQSSLDEVVKLATENQIAFTDLMRVSAGEFAKTMKITNDTLAANHKEFLNQLEMNFKEYQKDIFNAVRNIAADFERMTAANQYAVEKAMGDLTDAMEDLSKSTLRVSLDINEKIKHFNETTESIIKQIGATLDAFNTDFRKEIEKAVQQLITSLNDAFKEIMKATGEQSEIAVKNLATSLAQITERMTVNYTTLLNRIKEIDPLLASRRRI